MSERVKYFSKTDLSLSYNLQMAENVVDSYSNGKQPKNISDYLELYQITLFVKNGVVSAKWDENKQKEIEGYTSVVAKYLHTLKADEVPNLFSSLEYEYTDVFWEIIDKFHIKGLITKDNLRLILVNSPYALKEILKCEWLAKENNQVLADIFKEQERAAEILLECYVEDDRFGEDRKKLYIPSALSIEEKEEIISKYIDNPDVNLNYVRLVLVAKNTQEFYISDSTRLRAQRKEKELNDQILKQSNPLRINYTISMSEDVDAPIKAIGNGENLNPTLIYNSHVLRAQNAEGLVLYCARVFEFTNQLGLISLVSKKSNNGLTDILLGLSAQNTYKVNTSFHFNEAMSSLQTQAMQDVLNRDGRSIESELKTFYEDCLSNQYSYHGIPIDFANPSDKWRSKCTILLPLMDNIARQYTAFVQNGMVDPDFVAIMSPMKITDIPSCITKKYFVIDGQPQELNDLFYLFFSDQSMLTYVDPYKDKHYHTFYNLICNEDKIIYENYREYQKRGLDYLIQEGYLSVSQDGFLQVLKLKEIFILRLLYEYHACPYWQCNAEEQRIIMEMKGKGWVKEDNHLLTPEERDYFSYYLNNEKFTNGPALRNKYMHGAMTGNSEKQHQAAYYRLLNLFILLTIKIYEDLRLRQMLNK